MFVNLGPAQSNQNESKDSLGFGKLVSNIVTQQKARYIHYITSYAVMLSRLALRCVGRVLSLICCGNLTRVARVS
jgi:hypothetical protein